MYNIEPQYRQDDSFKSLSFVPGWAEASITCHTELGVSPNDVVRAGLRPSFRRAYRAGHREFRTM